MKQGHSALKEKEQQEMREEVQEITERIEAK